MNKNREQFEKAALAKTVFNSCTLCYREIRAGSLVSATDYTQAQKKSKTYCAGRPSKSDFICDVEMACHAVTLRMNFDWNKFQLAYLLPYDLDEHQEQYVERIFRTHQPVAIDQFDGAELQRQSSHQTSRILKDRNRRARLENSCGLEFLRRWGGGPKAYFQYQRRGINERCSPESQLILREPEGAPDGESALLPQSDNPALMALIESAFKYEESQGGMPTECGVVDGI